MKWIKPAVVKRVVDGDTVVLDIDLGFRTWLTDQHFRLVSVGPDGGPVRFDAPEVSGAKASEAGRAARAALAELLPPESNVTVQTFKGDDRDKYGRWLAAIWLAREEVGQDVARIMADGGHGVLTWL